MLLLFITYFTCHSSNIIVSDNSNISNKKYKIEFQQIYSFLKLLILLVILFLCCLLSYKIYNFKDITQVIVDQAYIKVNKNNNESLMNNVSADISSKIIEELKKEENKEMAQIYLDLIYEYLNKPCFVEVPKLDKDGKEQIDIVTGKVVMAKVETTKLREFIKEIKKEMIDIDKLTWHQKILHNFFGLKL